MRLQIDPNIFCTLKQELRRTRPVSLVLDFLVHQLL